MRRAVDKRPPFFEPTADVFQNVNALPPATLQDAGNHRRVEVLIPGKGLKVYQQHPCEIYRAGVPALENRVGEQSWTVTGGQNPDPVLLQRVLEVPVQGLPGADRKE